MSSIELIITCENCGYVEHLHADSYDESIEMFKQFRCPGQCSKKFYSYISSGEMSIKSLQNPVTLSQVA